MRHGDREAVGEFVHHYGDQVRRRVRGKMLRSHNRVFDSEDILSTLARRLDGLVREGGLKAESDRELWSLVLTISGHAVLRKNEVSGRYRRLEQGGDEAVGRELLERARERFAADPTSERLAMAKLDALLDDATEREVLRLWLRGRKLSEIASLIDAPEQTVRWRWGKIKRRLRDHLADEQESPA